MQLSQCVIPHLYNAFCVHVQYVCVSVCASSAFPGPPAPPKVVSAYDNCINLSWASPGNTGGSRILGYILEKRKKGSNLWTVVNAMDELIKGLYFNPFIKTTGIVSEVLF